MFELLPCCGWQIHRLAPSLTVSSLTIEASCRALLPIATNVHSTSSCMVPLDSRADSLPNTSVRERAIARQHCRLAAIEAVSVGSQVLSSISRCVCVCCLSFFSAGATNRRSQQGFAPLKWALGGRDAKKLGLVKAALKVDSSLASEPALVLADADDQQSLQRMTAQSRVVISTVGPYAQHGEPLVAACVKTGTDYCDLTGESPWCESMIRKYGEAAAKNGALIVNMCGYDSIVRSRSSTIALQPIHRGAILTVKAKA